MVFDPANSPVSGNYHVWADTAEEVEVIRATSEAEEEVEEEVPGPVLFKPPVLKPKEVR